MLKLLLNALVAGLIVILVGELARRYPRLSVLALTIPIVPFAVLASMYLKNADPIPSAKFARDFMIVAALCFPMFLPVALAPRFSIPFWIACAAGAAYCLIAIMSYILLTR